MPTSPDYTIANNSHCLIHAGPSGPEDQDDGREYYRATNQGKCQVAICKNGRKVEHVNELWTEVSGYSTDPTQTGAPARVIIAKNGDIILHADNGNIRLKARNIYFEATGPKKGGKSEGNFLVSANGAITLAGGEQVKVVGGSLCLRGEKELNLVSPGLIKSSGEILEGGAASTADFIGNLMAGNFQSLIDGILSSCK